MYVLAVDPGLNTGVALVGPVGVVWALTCTHPFDELTSALKQYHDAELVFEEIPTLHAHEKESQIFVERLMLDHSAARVRPSEWKGNPKSRLSKGDKMLLSSKHEIEAASIGTFHRNRSQA